MKSRDIVRSSLWMVIVLSVAFVPATAQFVQQGSKLVGTGAVGTVFQGVSVSLSADGNTAIVGGAWDNAEAGAAWVYTRSGGLWTQQGSKLVGTGAVGQPAEQGWSVALSGDGNTAIVGGWLDDNSLGAAWIFTRSGGAWTQQGSKLVGTGAVWTPEQGSSVAISADGNTAIVGGQYDGLGAEGAAWVYTRSGGVWTQQGSKLVGTGNVGISRQGVSVSLSADGNTAIVGGSQDDSNVGAVWVYTRSGGVWTQQGSKLVGTGAVGGAPQQGGSVVLSADGNTAIVGAIADNSSVGAAWVFTRSGGVWTQQGSKLVGAGAVGNAGQGWSVSLSGDGNTAIVGGRYDNSFEGAAWVYTRSGGVWTQQAGKLVGTGSTGLARQGNSVSLSADGTTAIVGGLTDNIDQGAAWIYYGPRKATNVSVTDIPGDQGGQVSLSWAKSPYDEISMSPQVTSYSIFRKSSPGPIAAQATTTLSDGLMADTSLLGYQYIFDVPAFQLAEYETVVPTLEDSSASGTPYFHFLVVARTEDLDQYFVSAPDSGYSVDNLSPIPPAGLLAFLEAGPQVDLTWDSPLDPDVGHYSVHRSTTSGFTPGPGNSIGTSASTSYTDVAPVEGMPNYYRVIAVDIHGNESVPSSEAEAAVTVNAQFNVDAQWNLLSVPLKMGDYTGTALFPTATTTAYAYDGGYFGHVTLENGRAYWMKFSGGQTVSHDGVIRSGDTVAVQAGWNMVGSLSSPIAAAGIGSIPGGIVTSAFFAYDGAYASSPTLDPGKGYWVKVSESGQLVLSDTELASSNLIRIRDDGELPPPPPDLVNEAVPGEYALEQNYPNPFNPVTSIRYLTPASGHVRLTVSNTLGQEVAVLVDESREPGVHVIAFDALHLPSGVYTYTITAGDLRETRKMLLIR